MGLHVLDLSSVDLQQEETNGVTEAQGTGQPLEVRLP